MDSLDNSPASLVHPSSGSSIHNDSNESVPSTQIDGGFIADEAEVFERFAVRLVRLADSKLPAMLGSKVDSEDIVQSVFRTFFRRNQAGEFHFDCPEELWRLLAAITWRKTINVIRFHHRDCRNVSRDRVERRPAKDQPALESVPDTDPGPEHLTMMAEEMDNLMSLFLPESRKIVQLRLDGYSIQETARQVQLSERTVKRTLARARQILMHRMRQMQ